MAGRDDNTIQESGNEHGSEMEAIIEEFNRKKDVRILVVGRTGVGKSTLIRSLFGVSLTKIQEGPSSAKQEILEEYEGKIAGRSVTVYDTRGYGAVKTSAEDAKLMSARLQKVFSPKSMRKVDLFIFCQLMFERFDEASLSILKNFGRLLGEDHWKISIVALTKADSLPLTLLQSKDCKGQMEGIVKTMKQDMQRMYFSEIGLEAISEDIPFVPVGCKTDEVDRSKLVTGKDSIDELKTQCILRCTPESACSLVSAFTTADIVLMVGAGVAGATMLPVAGAAVGGAIGAAVTFGIGGVGAIPGACIGAIVGGVAGVGGAAICAPLSAVCAKKLKDCLITRFRKEVDKRNLRLIQEKEGLKQKED